MVPRIWVLEQLWRWAVMTDVAPVRTPAWVWIAGVCTSEISMGEATGSPLTLSSKQGVTHYQ